MSDANVELSVIKKTQDTLGKYVKKPPLTDKLLKRPPFRFLHDIVNVIVKETGYLKGLYSDSDLISDNIKDRDAKIKFLQSLIDVVKISTGTPLTAKPSKIVAGQEPDKTNELLQAIAHAVENNIDSSEAVDTVKNGKAKAKSNGEVKPVAEKTSTPAKSDSKVKKVSSDISKGKKVEAGKITSQAKAKDKPVKQKVDTKIVKPIANGKIPVDKNAENKSRTKDKLLVRKSSSSDIIEKQQTKSELIEHQIDNALGPAVPDVPVLLLPTPSSVSIPTIDSKPIEEPKPIEPLTPKDSSKSESRRSNSNTTSLEPLKTFRNSSDELSAIIDEEAERRRNEKPKILENTSLRPNTSGKDDSLSEFENQEKRLEIEMTKNTEDDKSPPQIVVPPPKNGIKKSTTKTTTPLDKQKSYIKEPPTIDEQKRPRTSLRPPSVRPASARPGAPRRRDKNIEIVLQPDEIVKLGEINVKVESFSAELDDDGENLIVIEDVADPTSDLMFKTLGDKTNENAQGHLVQQILDTQKEFSTVAINNAGGNDEGVFNPDISSQRLASAKQINSLREALQKLTRAVNPLGKLFDFLQEDIDAMEREFDTWKENYKQTRILINREKGLTENAIEPMKHQLAQIELNIKEHVELINSSRANILQNEQKIYKLLTDV